jgi:hypothetical protein
MANTSSDKTKVKIIKLIVNSKMTDNKKVYFTQSYLLGWSKDSDIIKLIEATSLKR